MDNFERCNKVVGINEGGDNFNIIDGKPVLKPKSKNDLGGLTRMGITQGTLQRAYTLGIVEHNDITRLTRIEADNIYRINYWIPSRADKMAWGLCLIHYDCAVNCGIGGAAKQLQRALVDMGSKIDIDGVVGPASLKAVSAQNTDDLCDVYLKARLKYYHAIVLKNPSQGVFIKSWTNRLERIRAEASKNA